MINDEKYNLGTRTARFGETVIELAKQTPMTAVTQPIVSQLVRSSTSIGANYCEADNAESKKDFRHKIGICKKESRETMFWLQMLSKAAIQQSKECRILWKEAHELTLIFGAINRKQNSDLAIRH